VNLVVVVESDCLAGWVFWGIICVDHSVRETKDFVEDRSVHHGQFLYYV
jgi:hypothetical protein